jgi:hypothetical protein
MLCIQCGTDNSEGAKYCVSCNAVMPIPAPTGNPGESELDIEELVEYPIPETHYQSPVLQQLAWSVHEFIEEEGELEPVIEAYEAFREIFDGFKLEIPKLKEVCYSQQGVLEDDPMPSQIKYMVTQAETLFTEGEDLFEGYLDSLEELNEDDPFPEPEPLIEGTKKWLQCNDSVCVAFDFMVGRSKAFGELVEEIQEELKDVDLSDLEPKDEDLVPADSTDLG